jgi:hypothetical protein
MSNRILEGNKNARTTIKGGALATNTSRPVRVVIHLLFNFGGSNSPLLVAIRESTKDCRYPAVCGGVIHLVAGEERWTNTSYSKDNSLFHSIPAACPHYSFSFWQGQVPGSYEHSRYFIGHLPGVAITIGTDGNVGSLVYLH